MIQEDLKTLLTAALPTVPIYPVIGIQGTALPYIVYSRVISPVENVLAGNGTPPINQTRMQIDVYAQSYASAQATARARVPEGTWAVGDLELQPGMVLYILRPTNSGTPREVGRMRVLGVSGIGLGSRASEATADAADLQPRGKTFEVALLLVGKVDWESFYFHRA